MSETQAIMVLRGVNPKEVLLSYLKGECEKNVHEKVPLQRTKSVQVFSYSNTENCYTFKNSSGSILRIRTIGDICDGQCCLGCMKKIDTTSVLGIPIDMKKEEKGVVFTTCGRVCSLRCALAFVRLINCGKSKKLSMYEESEQYIHLMHHLSGGKGVLSPAPDFWNLQIFGGSMSREEFERDGEVVIPTVNIVPVKILGFVQKSN